MAKNKKHENGASEGDVSELPSPDVHAIQPGESEVLEEARKNAKRAQWAIWLIFVAALAAGIILRVDRTNEASAAITDLTMKVSERMGETTATPAKVVATATKELYAKDETGVGVDGFKALVRVLAYHQANDPGADPASVVQIKQAVAAEKAAAAAEAEADAAETAAEEAEEAASEAEGADAAAKQKVVEAKTQAAEQKRQVADQKNAATAKLRKAIEDRRQAILDGTNNLLRANLLVTSFIHAGILFIFPALFTIGVLRARRHIEAFSDVLDSTRTRERNFWNAVWWRRHSQFLNEEASPYFGRRFGFAVLASLSILYILAPAGLMATAVGEYTTLRAIPGGPSQPFWFKEFAQVSTFVLGLAGFLLYSLIVFARRAVSYDVTNRLFLSLWNRGLTVVILSLVLTAVDAEAGAVKALVFVAGVFPSTGLQAIGKIAQTGADKLANLESKGFASVPEIDSFKEGSLREMGIFDTVDLARSSLAEYLILTSRIEPRTLMKAVDRALLVEQLGPLTEKLEKIPAFTASELLLYARGPDAYAARWQGFGTSPPKLLTAPVSDADKQARLAKINEALEVDNATIHLDKLAANHNLKFIIDNQVCYDDA